MEATREAARALVKDGKLDILQKGKVVDPDSFKGPIRLRLRAEGSQGVKQDTKETSA